MPSGISATMLAELQGLQRVFPTFDLTLAGTTYQFASEPIASESEGRYEPFVHNWGIIERAAGDFPEYSLQNPRTTVDIYDRDRVLQKAVGGPANGTVINASANIVLRSYYVTASNHYMLFPGVVRDYRLVGDHLWQFVLTPDDSALLADTNKIPTLSNSDWFSSLPAASVGIDGQVVYGEHISSGIGDATGLVSCPPVYTSGTYTYWLVSIGSVEEVFNVWRNGTLATSDFSLSESWTINGAIYSLIVDTSGTSIVDDTITVDVNGIESMGDGTGTLLTDPIDIIMHFLVNFVFGSYPTGSTSGQWLSATGKPINSTHFGETQTFLSDRGHGQACAKVIRSSDSPVSVLNAICSSYKMSPFWSWDWDLGIRILDPAAEIYTSRHIQQVKHQILSEINSQTDSQKVVSRIIGDYLYQEATSAYALQTRVEDPDRTLISTADSFAFGESKVA